ncbi:MAG: hypothetical protein JXA54_16305 [Candidatus Heimdallarchaeota archaeon]|nr:hypothetical protein [Candidatus Heimdallarchaeota archaeon]
MSKDYDWNYEEEKKSEEEKPIEILSSQDDFPQQPTTEITYGTAVDTGQEPQLIDEVARKKKKRRNWVLISIFGITLPILLIIGSFVFVMLSIIGVFETCAVNCCSNCGESCAQSCEDTCCTSCSESCNNACSDSCSSSCSGCDCNSSSCTCGQISKISGTTHLMNQLKWTFYLLFGFLN